MNQRIKQLADNATHYANDVCDTDANADWYETRDQKFAELIIRECAEVASDYDGASYVGAAIEKHFGVEE